MELVAAIQPLRSLSHGARVELRSDSECLIRGMHFLVQRWRGQGWLWTPNSRFDGAGSKAIVIIRSNVERMNSRIARPGGSGLCRRELHSGRPNTPERKGSTRDKGAGHDSRDRIQFPLSDSC